MRKKFANIQRSVPTYMLSFLLYGPAIAEAAALLPSGWRMPTKFELSDEWRASDMNRFALVDGDFNGDGRPDKAMLLLDKNRQRFGVFVFLSQVDRSFKTYRLVASNNIHSLADMGIAKVESGNYHTACGKGYWICKKDEVPEIRLTQQSINYFKSEGASSYFYWDRHRGKFKRIWISD